jgi:hypothetical protein
MQSLTGINRGIAIPWTGFSKGGKNPEDQIQTLRTFDPRTGELNIIDLQ